MRLSVQTDPENGEVLAVYCKLRKGKVHRTVELAEDACYADEDSKENLLGIEMLAPGEVEIHIKRAARKYGISGLTSAFRKAREALATA